MKAIAIFLCGFLFALKLNAAEFYVVTNANDGAGSLRQAILDANENGDATLDHIWFNIPSVTIDDVVITLTASLPNLSSNLILDATTQPTSLLGSASIKIRLVRGSIDYFSGFNLDGISNVAIYGFYFSNFLSATGVPSDERKAGIFLNNTTDIVIGAPGKQNGFGANYTSIISPTTPNVQENITISSNIIGLNAVGNAANPNKIGIDLSYLSNSIIGGPTPAHGNIISANENGAASLGALKNNVVVQHNSIGFDITKSRTFYTAGSVGIFANGEFVHLSILANYIVAQEIGMRIDNTKNKFIISGNHIGVGPAEQNYGNKKYGIELYNCGSGLISGNEVAYNAIGLYMDLAYPISILKNSFYCNPKAMEVVKYPVGKSTSQSQISEITTTGAKGSYLPNATVELFYTDTCPDCQGKTWLATVSTDGNGIWNYSGSVTGGITSLGTNADGATAPVFSKPHINNLSVVTTGVNCGASTGTITIEVFDASSYQWYDRATGNLMGTQRKLTGVPNGTYYLKAGQLGACDVVSDFFTIDAGTNGINDMAVEISGTYCGAATGSIKKIIVANNIPRIWYNGSGREVSRTTDLENMPPGNYYFTIGEGSCKVTSKIYLIPNTITTYSVRSNQVQIKDATCGNSNGSITILGYENVSPDEIKWFNAQNIEISTMRSLNNLAPGRYTLVGFGRNTCTNTIGVFTVSEASPPTIDLSAHRKFLSCDGKSVSIQGIQLKGTTAPYTYTWINGNGEQVDDHLNLRNAPLDRYQLQVRDRNNCLVESQWIDFVELKATLLVIPNSFTPNGDGINDVWEIKGALNYPQANFSVYNRNGNRVFFSRGYTTSFNGSYNGKKLPVGTYYYIIDLKSDCGVQTGSLTIFH